MAFELAEFDDCLNATVVISTGDPTRDEYGVETWPAGGSTFQARYVRKAEQLRTPDGDIVEQVGILWIGSTVDISTHARVTLPDGSHELILGVDRFPDEDGTHHHRVRLGGGRG